MNEIKKMWECQINRSLLAAAGLLGLRSFMLSWVSPLFTLFVTVTLGVTYLILAVAAIERKDRQRAVAEPKPDQLLLDAADRPTGSSILERMQDASPKIRAFFAVAAIERKDCQRAVREYPEAELSTRKL